MITLEILEQYLNTTLHIKDFEDDPGLTITGKQEITTVCGAVDLSLSVIERARNMQCDALLTHHAAWNSTDAELVERKHEMISQSGFSLYSAHDSLDFHRTLGTAITFTNLFGWTVHDVFLNGLGIITTPGEHMSLTQVDREICETLGSPTTCYHNAERLGRIGIITGWGARPEWMQIAKEHGAETFVSGEAIHFGKLYAHETHMNLLLAGHYSTEAPAIQGLLKHIAHEFRINVEFIDDERSKELR